MEVAQDVGSLLILSVPQVEDALPATVPVIQIRTLLVRPGMNRDQVEHALGLHKYLLSSAVFSAREWYVVHHSPDRGHTHGVSVHYFVDGKSGDLRFMEVEVVILKPDLGPSGN